MAELPQIRPVNGSQLGDADAAGLRAGVDRVYAAVEKEDAYSMSRFVEALKALRAAAN